MVNVLCIYSITHKATKSISLAFEPWSYLHTLDHIVNGIVFRTHAKQLEYDKGIIFAAIFDYISVDGRNFFEGFAFPQQRYDVLAGRDIPGVISTGIGRWRVRDG
ncbi:hypothetical protein ACH5RR_010352 [Cinchona calisaya]|uniref:Uncharacterized protein n=1 Tax=Cinchona calisaya TaxID=153742 RepID=A0ABD3AIP6_9GENT